MIPIYALTNNNHIHLMQGFSYLWNKYSDEAQRVTVVCFDPPNFNLPKNFKFYSLGQQIPASKWSNGLIQLLEEIDHTHFILMLEDYWLYDYVDRLALNWLTELMTNDVLRIDLSGNRASYTQARLVNQKNGIDIVQTPEGTPYQMSFQAAIWNRQNMLEVLKANENPWQAEIDGSDRVGDLTVLGTSPAIMKYQPVWRSQQKRWQLDKIKPDDLEYIKGQGWVNNG